MAKRKIMDARDLTSGELIYFKGHAKATYLSDGTTLEDFAEIVNEKEKVVEGSLVNVNNRFQELETTDSVLVSRIDNLTETVRNNKSSVDSSLLVIESKLQEHNTSIFGLDNQVSENKTAIDNLGVRFQE